MISICFCSTANSYRFRSCSPIVVPVGARGSGAVVGLDGEVMYGTVVNFLVQRLELGHVDRVSIFRTGGYVSDLAGTPL